MGKKWILTLVLIVGLTAQGWGQLSALNLRTEIPSADLLRSIGLSASHYTQIINAAGGGYAGWESSARGFTIWWQGRSESNRLAVENRLQREGIPSNNFTLYRQASFGPASGLRYYEEGELSLSFVHNDASLVAGLIAGTYQYYDSYGNKSTISFSGNNFTAVTPFGLFTGRLEITGRTFTLTGHNSRDNWLTGRWEIFSGVLSDPDGDLWEYISNAVDAFSAEHYRLFIERVGRMNAELFPPNRFTWNNAAETLTFKSRLINFTGTDWGLIHSPITFYKEMEVRFQGKEIVNAQWRYVYISAETWFQIGRPGGVYNPIMSQWFYTAVPNNNVSGTGINGVINTLVHFENLRIGSTYTFIRGNGSNTTLTVRTIE